MSDVPETMEESALNVAHSLERQAIACLKRRRYDEAILHYSNATEYLNRAVALTQNPQAILSLKIQRNFLVTQTRVILARKEQYLCLRKALEMEKYAAKMLARIGDAEEENVKLRLISMLNTAESLINELTSRKSISEEGMNQNETNAVLDLEELNERRDARDSMVIIQELHLIITNLHTLAIQIANQLDQSEFKREQLEQKLSKLEAFWRQTTYASSGASTAPVTIRSPSPDEPSSSTEQPEPSTSGTFPSKPPTVVSAPTTAPSCSTAQFVAPKMIEAGDIPESESICQFPNFADFDLPPLPPLDLPEPNITEYASRSSDMSLPSKSNKNNDKRGSEDDENHKKSDKMNESDKSM